LGFLLERMQHVDPFGKLRKVEHSVFQPSVNSDFIDPMIHRSYWLKVRWLQPLLDQSQKVTGVATSVFRKSAKILQRGSDPEEGFLVHEGSI